MHGFRWTALAALTAAVLGACGGGAPGPVAPVAAEAPCDRACLDGLVDGYIEALIAHDPGKIPAAAGIRFVENGVELPLGTALWRTASGRGTYSHEFANVASGRAGGYTKPAQGTTVIAAGVTGAPWNEETRIVVCPTLFPFNSAPSLMDATPGWAVDQFTSVVTLRTAPLS